jgi:enediyne biosynthesis protein E4
VADYDGDDLMDVFVTNDTEPNFLFRNLGNGRFEETGLLAGAALLSHGRPISSMGAEFRDYDNDGWPDLHVTALAGETFPLFRNDRGRQFLDQTASSGLGRATLGRSGWGTVMADFDNDGWKDLFTANSHVNDHIEAFEAHAYREPNSLLRNAGNGTFVDISRDVGADFQTPRAHRGAIAVDLNDDGRLDVVTTSLGDRPEIWENRTAPANRWLVVTPVGTKSNRDGIGTRIRIGRQPNAQMNAMTTVAGYASSVNAGVHFGLGLTETIDRLEIAWPSGSRQVLEGVKTNQRLVVTER